MGEEKKMRDVMASISHGAQQTSGTHIRTQ